MIRNFKCRSTDECPEKETLKHVEGLLELHSFETPDLIHQYYIERLKQQEAMSDSPYGILSIRAEFTDDNLLKVNHIQIILSITISFTILVFEF